MKRMKEEASRRILGREHLTTGLRLTDFPLCNAPNCNVGIMKYSVTRLLKMNIEDWEVELRDSSWIVMLENCFILFSHSNTIQNLHIYIHHTRNLTRYCVTISKLRRYKNNNDTLYVFLLLWTNIAGRIKEEWTSLTKLDEGGAVVSGWYTENHRLIVLIDPK